MGAGDNRKTALRFYAAFNQRDYDAIRNDIADGFVTDSVPQELGLGRHRPTRGRSSRL